MENSRYLAFALMLLGSIAAPPPAHAEIDPSSGTFLDTWIDFHLPGPGMNLVIRRMYNSRSTQAGLFGFGWCSDLETRLVMSNDPAAPGASVIECGGGQSTQFIPLASASKQEEKSFVSLSLPIETITFERGRHQRVRPDGIVQYFDSKGRLDALSDGNNHYWKIQYSDTGVPRVLTDEVGRSLRFTANPDNRIVLIEWPGKAKAEYRYEDKNLVRVKNAWGNSYSYKYDGQHNLIEIAYPDKTRDRIVYDKNRDWVVGLFARNGCTELLAYEIKQDIQGHTSRIARTCPGSLPLITKREYKGTLRRSMNAGNYRTESREDRGLASVSAFDRNGRMFESRRALGSFGFKIDDLGEVSEISKGPRRFNYLKSAPDDRTRTVIVRDENFDQFGPYERPVRYQLDQRGKVTAIDTRGQKYFMKYDSKGRLITVSDPKGVQFSLTYSGSNSQPSQIGKPGLGIVYFEYLPDGTLGKTETKLSPEQENRLIDSWRRIGALLQPQEELKNVGN